MIHLYDSLQKEYKFTAAVRILCVDDGFEFREDVIDMNIPSIVHYIHSNDVVEMVFVNLIYNNKFRRHRWSVIKGEASPECNFYWHECELLTPWSKKLFWEHTISYKQFNIVPAMKSGEWSEDLIYPQKQRYSGSRQK